MLSLTAIGAGNMGLAILNGSVRSKIFEAKEIGVYDVSEEKRTQCRDIGYTVFDSEADAYKNSRLLLLAVKPQNFEGLLKDLSNVTPPESQIIITIGAGISTGFIQSFLGSDKKVVRVMPNTPLLIGKGASALCRTKNVSDKEFKQVKDIFDALGITAVIDEGQMNEIIPVNGSSPAYVYYFIDALLQSAVKAGIDQDVAKTLICQTFIGAATMVLEGETDTQTLIKNVCSPGGTTIESIKTFDEYKLYDIIDEACKKCAKRAYEIGR